MGKSIKIEEGVYGHKCEHEGCFEDGCVKCHLPEPFDDEGYPEKVHAITEHFCWEHAFRNGYCICCGEFWGGIEDFDFGNGLCENCQDACDLENGEPEENEHR